MTLAQRLRLAMTHYLLEALGGAVLSLLALVSPQSDSDTSPASQPTPGHSMHAESFNEGPRQAAYLMTGMGNVHFPISTKHALAQRYFDQGVSQLHGFWYFEAERSFRQAAAIDPDHPMPYWGMARANIKNEARSVGLIKQAVDRLARANDKERRLIEAWHERVKVAEKKQEQSEEIKKQSGEKQEQSDKSPVKNLQSKEDEREQKEQKEQKEKRLKRYMTELDEIAADFPEDIEIKAMIVLQAWENQGDGVSIQSYTALNSLLAEIFQANPRHPAHHFRIHLWDYKKEQLALQSAALCGPSAPGIAHMWHMPGHTYSRLKRFADAAWQQEASARVDHAYMIRDQLMPDQIHNYAHNNEWLIRSLGLIGRPNQAVAVAKNMIEMPRHPKYNHFDNRGSATYGRERLVQILVGYQRWAELLELTDTQYLAEEADLHRSDERLGLRAIAAVYVHRPEVFQVAREMLQRRLEDSRQAELTQTETIDRLKQPQTPPEKASQETSSEVSDSMAENTSAESTQPQASEEGSSQPDSTNATSTAEATASELFGDPNDPKLPKELKKNWQLPEGEEAAAWSQERKDAERARHEAQYRQQRLNYWLSALAAHEAAARADYHEAIRQSHLARPVVSQWQRIEWLAECGEVLEAWKHAEKNMKDHQGEFLPLVQIAWLAALLDNHQDKLQELIEKLKPIAAGADSGIAALEKLKSTLQDKGVQVDWDCDVQPAKDIGERPALDSLGPLYWQPSQAPIWSAVQADGTELGSNQLAGRPYLLVMYLGFGCLHCVEQLGAISPRSDEFKQMGLELIAVSTEDTVELRRGQEDYGKPVHLSLLSSARHDVFKAFRAYDDFEGQPLHGTFLVDRCGRILWQDIGHEPFMDIEFLVRESSRLLQLAGAEVAVSQVANVE